MLGSSINQKIADALKSKDEVRLSTLRLLSSAFNYEKIAKQHELSGEEEIAVIKREAKKRQDAIGSLREAQKGKSTSDETTLKARLEREEKELAILKEFLPEEMSDDELKKIVENAISETGASGMKDMGKVIGLVMGKAKGRADGKKVSEMIKKKLT